MRKQLKKIITGLICFTIMFSTIGICTNAETIDGGTVDRARYYWTINGSDSHEYEYDGTFDSGMKKVKSNYDEVISQIEEAQTPGWTSERWSLVSVDDERTWTLVVTPSNPPADYTGDYTRTVYVDGKKTDHYTITFYYGDEPTDTNESGVSSHTHFWSYGTIYEATESSDGLEGECCSCGAVRNTSVIPAAQAVLNKRIKQLRDAKSGSTIILEMGLWNSLPPYFMNKIAERNDCNIIIRFEYEHKNYEAYIPAGTTFDTSLEWYGPKKIMDMFQWKQLN